MIIGIDNDKLKFVADSNGKLVVTLENLTDAIVKKELLQNCVITRCKDCKYWCTDDGMFKDIDERQWHHCSHIGIDTEEYFFCSEAERKEE